MPPTTSWSGQRRSFPTKTRRLILNRDPECQLRYPCCTIVSTEADHIIPHGQALALGWDQADIDDPRNGQGVCIPCHQVKTRAEQTAGRQQAAAKRSRKRPTERHPGLI